MKEGISSPVCVVPAAAKQLEVAGLARKAISRAVMRKGRLVGARRGRQVVGRNAQDRARDHAGSSGPATRVAASGPLTRRKKEML